MKMCALHKTPEGAAPAAPEKKNSLAEQHIPAQSVAKPAETSVTQTTRQEEVLSIPEEPVAAATEYSEIPEETNEVVSEAQEEPKETPEVTSPNPSTVSLSSRRRFSRSTVRISEAHLLVEEEEINLEEMPKDGFTEEQMQEIWNNRVNLLFEGKPSILSSLTKHKPILKEGHTIELKLDGKHQLEQLQDTRSVLIDAIRKDLNNYAVQLETPVEEVLTSKKAYTPKEIYHQLLNENPHLDTLREQLGLDLDV
ncbi:MAG: hypothetical protein EP314_01015 [Bacteroidetes bacterium]|nr:MAG: hypothetical protein EP314_01015 [Bacteroidota bacterium]